MPTYYVTKAGNDANDGTSQGTAKLTINAGLGLLKGGDTLLVGAGTYDEGIKNPDISGTAGAYTKIHALPGETVWLTPTSGDSVIHFSDTRAYIEFDGINASAAHIAACAIRVEVGQANPHHIRVKHAEIIGPKHPGQTILLNYQTAGANGGNEFQHLTVHGGGTTDFDHGIYIQSCDNLVEDCTFYDFPGAGIHIYNGYGLAPNGNIIRRNTIRDGRSTEAGQRHWGIILYSATAGIQVDHNTIDNIPSDGKATAGIEIEADNCAVSHNTITRVAGPGISILEAASGTILTNNTSENDIDNGSGTTVIDGAPEPEPEPEPEPPPSGGVFVQDTFTGPAGTDLTAHTGEGGATWTRHPASENIPGLISEANRCRVGSGPGAQGAFWTASGTPATADYRVTAQIVATRLGEEQSVVIYGRADPSAYTTYELAYVRSVTFGQAAQWRLGKRVDGAFTPLGAPVEVTLNLNQVYTMQVEMHGPTITGSVDGVPIITATDSDIPAAGRAGFGFWGGDSVGLEVESLDAADRQAGELDEGYQPPIDNTPPPVG